MRDLAAYYAYLPRPSDLLPTGARAPHRSERRAHARDRALWGLSRRARQQGRRGMARGQPAVYLRAQLEAFSSGARHNDISEQMRNIARRMTAAEIDAASQFYADRP